MSSNKSAEGFGLGMEKDGVYQSIMTMRVYLSHSSTLAIL